MFKTISEKLKKYLNKRSHKIKVIDILEGEIHIMDEEEILNKFNNNFHIKKYLKKIEEIIYIKNIQLKIKFKKNQRNQKSINLYYKKNKL